MQIAYENCGGLQTVLPTQRCHSAIGLVSLVMVPRVRLMLWTGVAVVLVAECMGCQTLCAGYHSGGRSSTSLRACAFSEQQSEELPFSTGANLREGCGVLVSDCHFAFVYVDVHTAA
jgi:hypothetical protein